MRNESHNSLISIVKRHVIEWRKREGWSRETVVQVIVEAHERIGGQVVSGIRFDPETKDTFERMKVNADRVFRWLDDESKDTNLLPANFLQSILAAMPLDIRISCVEEFLMPVGLGARCLNDESHDGLNLQSTLVAMMKEGTEATQAVAGLIGGVTPEKLEAAHKELTEDIETLQRVRGELEAEVAKYGRALA
jgi:ribosomal protein S16